MKNIFLISFSLLHLSLFSQKNNGVIHIYAYYEQHMPGNIRVDEKGEPIQKGSSFVDLIYVETSSDEIKWDTGWKNGKTFSINTILITQVPYEVGRKKSNREKIILTPAKGNQLWQLELQPAEQPKISPIKAKKGEIILKGKYRGKIILKKINTGIELYVPNAV
jgi:hypothetical protein